MVIFKSKNSSYNNSRINEELGVQGYFFRSSFRFNNQKVTSLKQRTFTLVEIIIIVAIISILVSLAIPIYLNFKDKALDNEAKSMLELIQAAEKMNRLKTGEYQGCADTASCNNVLDLDLRVDTTTEGWVYSVEVNNESTTPTFCAQASREGSSGWHINSSDSQVSSGGCSGGS